MAGLACPVQPAPGHARAQAPSVTAWPQRQSSAFAPYRDHCAHRRTSRIPLARSATSTSQRASAADCHASHSTCDGERALGAGARPHPRCLNHRGTVLQVQVAYLGRPSRSLSSAHAHSITSSKQASKQASKQESKKASTQTMKQTHEQMIANDSDEYERRLKRWKRWSVPPPLQPAVRRAAEQHLTSATISSDNAVQ